MDTTTVAESGRKELSCSDVDQMAQEGPALVITALRIIDGYCMALHLHSQRRLRDRLPDVPYITRVFLGWNPDRPAPESFAAFYANLHPIQQDSLHTMLTGLRYGEHPSLRTLHFVEVRGSTVGPVFLAGEPEIEDHPPGQVV